MTLKYLKNRGFIGAKCVRGRPQGLAPPAVIDDGPREAASIVYSLFRLAANIIYRKPRMRIAFTLTSVTSVSGVRIIFNYIYLNIPLSPFSLSS